MIAYGSIQIDRDRLMIEYNIWNFFTHDHDREMMDMSKHRNDTEKIDGNRWIC